MEIDKEILKGHIDTILLAALAHKEQYGYELAKYVREKSDGQFELKEGTMYLALKRLEKNAYVESYWGEADESGGGRRKYYRLLPEGRERYVEKQGEWQLVKAIMDTFLGGEAR